jgi:6,7-dimethyl-8-ribityllumazine synthase
MRTIEGGLDASDVRIGIVVSRFNDLITRQLLEGARDCLRRHGGNDERLVVVWVPGAFEIPLAAQRLARSGAVDAVVCLGAVIRGATAHFEHVAGQSAAGVARVALETDVPVTFGILTTDTTEQALERAGVKGGNKGADAMLAAIEMAHVLGAIEPVP